MKKGSVTIFLALVLILILSFVFSLLEGARVYCLNGKAQTVSRLCMQSVFANYHCGIWEDYHLLFLDGTWQGEEFSIEELSQKAMNEVTKNLLGLTKNATENNWEFTQLNVVDIEIQSCQLATDYAGSIFRSQVSRQMQLEATEAVLEELFQIKKQSQDIQKQQEQKESTWQQAWEAITQAGKMLEELQKTTSEVRKEQQQEQLEAVRLEQQEKSEVVREEVQEKFEVAEEEWLKEQTEIENPMEYVKELKNSGLLAIVLKDPSQLSARAVQEADFLMDRKLRTGNGIPQEEKSLERFWLQYYIQNYFSNYVAVSQMGAKEKVLAYEWEYILAGRKSDSENLEEVVKRLLAVREVMNFASLMQNAQKKNLAFRIATATVGFTGMLPLIKAVQAGVLLAWAFVESVLDVRALLEGEKIPLLKNSSQWNSDLTNCRKSIEEQGVFVKADDGWNYNQYLQTLLFLQSEEMISYRCMDLIERNEQVQMDAMLQGIECVFTYEAKPLFWSFNRVVQKGWEHFSFLAETEFSYGY